MKLFGMIPIPKIRRVKAKLPSPGSAPGTLAPAIGAQANVRVTRCMYGPDSYELASADVAELDELFEPVPGRVVWVDIQGLGDAKVIRRAASKLGLHPLTLEDIVHTHQRAKAESFDDHGYVVLRALRLLDDKQVDDEQVSFVLKEGILVTFQERPEDGFTPVRRRIKLGSGSIRKHGSDYLFYALVDAVIDNYFPVIDAYGDTMDYIDERLHDEPTPVISRAVHKLRRELRALRRATSPLQDVSMQLTRSELNVIGPPVRLALRDCYDHALRANELVVAAQERSAELAELYLAMMSEKTNQVMRVLTIIATIFIPLTFLCGLYGMNFDPAASPYNMPELGWRYGYPAFWGLLVVVLVAMLWIFRRKGWLGSKH